VLLQYKTATAANELKLFAEAGMSRIWQLYSVKVDNNMKLYNLQNDVQNNKDYDD